MRTIHRRAGALLLAAALAVSACTSDDEPAPDAASPSATESSEPDGASEPDDDPSPSVTPSDEEDDDADDGADDGDGGADDTTDGGTDGDGQAGADDGADDEPSEEPAPSGEPTPSEEPDTGSGTPGGPATDTPSTAVSYDTSGSAFVADTSHTRAADFSRACHVVPASGEDIHECLKIHSDANDAWMGLVEATAADGTTSVTVYAYDGSGFTSALRAPADSPDIFSLASTDWANAEDLARVSRNDGTDLIAWDRAGQPRLVARIPAGGTTTYTAQRVVRRTSAGVEVLAVPSSGGGLSGSRTAAGSEEDVALRVYDAWVRGDRAAAAAHATDEVLQELFEGTPAPNDSYELDGTDCPASGTQVACGFTARFDGQTIQLTWTLGTVDGALKVVKLG